MDLRSQIKINSRLAIKKEWGKAIAILMIIATVWIFFVMIEALCYVIFDVQSFVDVLGTKTIFYDDLSNTAPISFIITGGSMLLSFVVLTPLLLGQARWYFNVIECKKPEVSSLFYYFERLKLFVKGLYITLNVLVRKFCWGVLFFLPSGAVFYGGYVLTDRKIIPSDDLSVVLIAVLGGLLALLSSVLYFIFINRYVLVPYLYAEDQGIKTRRLVSNSVRAMKGRRVELFEFYISFAPWFLSCLAVLPILYVLPYFLTAKALYSKYFIEALRQSTEQTETVKMYEYKPRNNQTTTEL